MADSVTTRLQSVKLICGKDQNVTETTITSGAVPRGHWTEKSICTDLSTSDECYLAGFRMQVVVLQYTNKA